MKKYKIKLNSIDKIKQFNQFIFHYDCDFDILSGRYIIDAKSIMGLFSLDLSHDLVLIIHYRSEEQLNEIITGLSKFLTISEYIEK